MKSLGSHKYAVTMRVRVFSLEGQCLPRRAVVLGTALLLGQPGGWKGSPSGGGLIVTGFKEENLFSLVLAYFLLPSFGEVMFRGQRSHWDFGEGCLETSSSAFFWSRSQVENAREAFRVALD